MILRTRKPRASKKRNEALAKRLRAVLIELGASPNLARLSDGELVMDTPAGILCMHVYAHDVQPGAWVAGRFHDNERAVKLLGASYPQTHPSYSVGGVNPYSGKWNHDYFTDDGDAAERDLRYWFEKVRKA